MALTNVATCLQSDGTTERDFINGIATVEVGDKTLFTVLVDRFLGSGNSRIKLAACELVSNLSLSRSVVDAAEQESGQFLTACRSLINALVVATEQDELKIEMQRAVLGFFANLAAHDVVRELFEKEAGGKCVSVVVPDALNSEPAIVHRVLFLADEILREDEVNIFDRLDRNKTLAALQKYEGAKSELGALCSQFTAILRN